MLDLLETRHGNDRMRVHYLLPRVEGGKDNVTNLVLMHPDCHDQLHAEGLNVEKPVPARGL